MSDITIIFVVVLSGLVAWLVFGGSQLSNLLSSVGAGMGKLTAQQISTYAQNAGFSGDDLVTAVAVALAESGGNPSAYNPETAAGAPPGMGSYGLWQIYLNAHPEAQGQNLNDPQVNANFAYAIFQRQGWTAWSTYSSGAYLSYLSAAQTGVNA